MAKQNFRTPKQRQHKINHEIRFNRVRLVGENVNGGNLLTSSDEALKLADDLGLDLVLINESTEIPTCKILNYEKFIYEQEKNKSKNKPLPLKEIKLGPNIGDHDLNTKVNQIIKFLEKGHKVKTIMEFRGREMAHQELGLKVLLTVATKVEDYGIPEGIPDKAIGKSMIMQIKPKSNG